MKNRKNYSILTKVGVFYLLFTLISFLVSGWILKKEATRHMDYILDRRLEHRERWVMKLIEKNSEKLKDKSYAVVTKAAGIPTDFEKLHYDTVIVNEETQQEEVHRKRINYVTVSEDIYRIEIHKSAEELYRFRDDIFEIMIPVFIILSITIILINYLLSGYLFEPFKSILKQIGAYTITQKQPLKLKKTTTREFDELQQHFKAMQDRIRKDYFQLKNYTENMSHELQTPLSVIRNKTEQLLSDTRPDEKQALLIKSIYDESKSLSRLGSVLNLITKIENEEFSNIDRVNSTPLIEAQLINIKDFSDNRDLKINTKLFELHYFKIDKDLFDIMLGNLFKNCIYYTPIGGNVLVETNEKSLIISNEGQPLDFNSSEIFNRFKRGNNSKSLGLGLSIIKQICDLSGLLINYQYQNGKHIFTITPK